MKCIHSTTTVEWLPAARAVCVAAPARLKRHHCPQEKLPLLLVPPFPHGSTALARRNIAAVYEACILAVCVTNVTSCQPLRACRLVTCRAIQHIHSGTPTCIQQSLEAAATVAPGMAAGGLFSERCLHCQR
jgi:hypothetical protein